MPRPWPRAKQQQVYSFKTFLRIRKEIVLTRKPDFGSYAVIPNKGVLRPYISPKTFTRIRGPRIQTDPGS
jgi:hypothetical protein